MRQTQERRKRKERLGYQCRELSSSSRSEREKASTRKRDNEKGKRQSKRGKEGRSEWGKAKKRARVSEQEERARGVFSVALADSTAISKHGSKQQLRWPDGQSPKTEKNARP